jgi:hypothetical protein
MAKNANQNPMSGGGMGPGNLPQPSTPPIPCCCPYCGHCTKLLAPYPYPYAFPYGLPYSGPYWQVRNAQGTNTAGELTQLYASTAGGTPTSSAMPVSVPSVFRTIPIVE